jgi:hypothetical protein
MSLPVSERFPRPGVTDLGTEWHACIHASGISGISDGDSVANPKATRTPMRSHCRPPAANFANRCQMNENGLMRDDARYRVPMQTRDSGTPMITDGSWLDAWFAAAGLAYRRRRQRIQRVPPR